MFLRLIQFYHLARRPTAFDDMVLMKVLPAFFCCSKVMSFSLSMSFPLEINNPTPLPFDQEPDCWREQQYVPDKRM